MAVRKIKTLYETPAINLLQRGAEIIGLAAEQNGKRIRIRANRAVILTCGGFENNQTILREYVNHIPRAATMGDVLEPLKALLTRDRYGMHLVMALELVAATCTTGAYVPQFVKAWRSRPTADVSLSMFGMMFVGIVLWLA